MPYIYLLVRFHGLQKLLQGDISRWYNTRKDWNCMQLIPCLPSSVFKFFKPSAF